MTGFGGRAWNEVLPSSFIVVHRSDVVIVWTLHHSRTESDYPRRLNIPDDWLRSHKFRDEACWSLHPGIRRRVGSLLLNPRCIFVLVARLFVVAATRRCPTHYVDYFGSEFIGVKFLRHQLYGSSHVGNHREVKEIDDTIGKWIDRFCWIVFLDRLRWQKTRLALLSLRGRRFSISNPAHCGRCFYFCYFSLLPVSVMQREGLTIIRCLPNPLSLLSVNVSGARCSKKLWLINFFLSLDVGKGTWISTAGDFPHN
jgi:hypothetical protein